MANIKDLLYSAEKRNLPLREKIENELTINRSSGQVAAYEYLSKPRTQRRINTTINGKKWRVL